MPRLPNLAERIYLAKRAAHVAGLADVKMSRAEADCAVTACEVEARGLARDEATCWLEGEAWILARRS